MADYNYHRMSVQHIRRLPQYQGPAAGLALDQSHRLAREDLDRHRQVALAEAGLEAHLSNQQTHKPSAEVLAERELLQQPHPERKSYPMNRNPYYKEVE